MNKSTLTWLEPVADRWRTATGRHAHAMLLLGPKGVGKRSLARWMAESKLGNVAEQPPSLCDRDPELADLQIVAPLEDKTTIGIDQIRSLISETSLTSYTGRGKVAIVEPANAMTREAANSLLKTLEEPQGDALIILVADRAGRLPATIFSRCQQIGIAVPDADMALAWLNAASPGHDWRDALEVAGGAPLRALELLDSLDLLKSMSQEFRAVAEGRESPVSVAGRWFKLDTTLVLDWLANQVLKVAKARSGCKKCAGVLGLSNSVLQRMDTRKVFCYLDIINRFRASRKGSFNVQLAFERLLVDWSDGLAHVAMRQHFDGLDHILADGQTA